VQPRCSTHALDPAQAIELARALGRLPARLVVWGVEGRSFALGAPPSAAVLAGIERLIERLTAELASSRDSRPSVPQGLSGVERSRESPPPEPRGPTAGRR
jgi:hydrogenase maturation protease